jgi:hypothetical protein
MVRNSSGFWSEFFKKEPSTKPNTDAIRLMQVRPQGNSLSLQSLRGICYQSAIRISTLTGAAHDAKGNTSNVFDRAERFTSFS